MKVRDLGEFGLIDVLRKIADDRGVGRDSRPNLVLGIGDDAAAWETRASILLATTDTLVEDVHFSLKTTSWRDLGWKALAVNISDIAAMGGAPKLALISLALPGSTHTSCITELYEGMAGIAARFEMSIAGGDVSQSPVLTITPTVIGKASQRDLLQRSGAVAGDLIAVTGSLGASAAGLSILGGKREVDPEFASILKEAHLRPSARVAEARILALAGVRAAIDISDGMVADLAHICRASGVGAIVRTWDVPVHPAVAAACPRDALELALAGGEDYELLFTAPKPVIDSVATSLATPVTIIGEIAADQPGTVTLVDSAGRETTPEHTGWEHFKG